MNHKLTDYKNLDYFAKILYQALSQETIPI